jgi:S-adenosylmethionine hydrolase
MSIITLTTDWHHRDYYLGALKGRLLSYCPKCQLVDISHKVTNFNIAQAAFILKNAYKHFPKGSLHIVGINSEASEGHPHLALKYDGHYFIGTDNGIFSLMFKNNPEEMVKIENIQQEEEYRNFPELNIFSKVAKHIFQHQSLEGLGSSHEELYRLIPIRAVIQQGTITGRVIYIDSYHNAVTNISRELFQSVRHGRDFEIMVQSNHYIISKINSDYHETPEGEILALFNSAGMLEISINKGRLAELLQLDTNSDVRIKFHDN